MLNSQSCNQQRSYQYHHEQEENREISRILSKEFSAATTELEDPLSIAARTTTPTSAFTGPNANSIHPNKLISNHDSSRFFTFNDLTVALQQEQINTASSLSSSSSSSIFATAAPYAKSTVVITAPTNRMSSVSPSSSRSSSSTFNLGNSLNGFSSKISEHIYLGFNNHGTSQQHYNMSQSQSQQNSTGGTDFTIGNQAIPNVEQYIQQQSHQMYLYQHSSPSSNQFQRSVSSTSSSMTSPTFIPQQKVSQMQTQFSNPAQPSKSCWCFGSDATYHFKTLVPAVAAGAIIGKGGETIATLQRDTGGRVKMSKSHDFYPGTSERVCLITGSIDAIMTVLDFIMEKIREKPDLTSKISDIEAKQAQERDKQVKILVPNSTAGMIIGKAGAYIKQIKEESGSYVQISQKPKDITLQERCITIIGEKENNKIACKMILAKIVEDPQSGTCLNVSYADINGPVANYNPTGSPYATNQNAISSSTASLNTALSTSVGAGAGLLVNGTSITLSINLGSPNPTPNAAVASQFLDHIKVNMRSLGYSETMTSEVCTALGVLAKYGVLGVGVGLPHTNGAHSAAVSYLGVSALEPSAAAATAAAAGNVFGALGQVNLESYIGQSSAAPRPTIEAAAAAQFDPFRHAAGSQAATPITLNNNSFGLAAATTGASATAQALGAQTLGALSKSPTPADIGAKDTKNVEIPEVIVGAILGPSGRSLVEIQHMSGANIQISKKGIFAPGTRNRIVTITGQPNAISMAQFLIDQKINEEKTKRAHQNPAANTTP